MKKEQRVLGLDFLKIISMLMIVTLHWLAKGGALFTDNITSYSVARIIEIFCMGAVNIYVLISGYFLSDKKMSIKKILKLERQILFYSIILLLISICIGTNVSKSDILFSFFPTITKIYWFNTIYILMCAISPFLNILIQNMNKSQHFSLCALLIGIFSVLGTILPYKCLIDTTYGYGIIWFICLYFTAAYIRKYLDDLKGKKFLFIYLIGSLLLGLFTIITEMLLNKLGLSNTLNDRFYAYNSIFVFITSVSIFIYFKGIKIKNKFLSKFIIFTSPLTFGVYLIHDNFLVERRLYLNFFKSVNYTYGSIFNFIIMLLISVCSIFFVCIIIEYFRTILFKKIATINYFKKINKTVEQKYDSVMSKLKEKLSIGD